MPPVKSINRGNRFTAMDGFSAAFDFALKAHGQSTRKGTAIPYIVHPLDVASILLKNGAPGPVVVAGFLHDVVEDTDTPLSAISEAFGEEVGRLVAGASEPEELKRHPDKKGTWRARKAHTVDHIRAASREQKMLSCADKLANISDMLRDRMSAGEGFWSKLNATRGDQAWYYKSMHAALGAEPGGIADLPMHAELRDCIRRLFG
jgi:(p)ppGpp synthase/HD superfamily hydrolase